MKKTTLFLVLFLSVLTVALAKTRTSQEAIQAASTFLQQTKSTVQKTPSSTYSIQLAYSCVDKKATMNEALYYVYNVGDKNGFVIVSGDDRATEILGYSDNGNFDINTIPDNFKYWLSCYENELKNLPLEVSRTSPYTNSALSKVKATDAETFLTAINPLLGSIQWGQGSPYNILCPVIDSITGKKAVTGCVATGMAQVMRYHKWPIQGTGSNSYITDSLKIPLSLDFSQTTFDWDNMSETYGSSSTAIQDTAVATLMYNCGVAVNMDYNNSSGAFTDRLAIALKTNFGYDANLQYNKRNYYTRNEWITLLKIELNASRPVVYRGQTKDGAHLFVCDGYDSNDLFHFNWGWSGTSNGYFVVSALNPIEQGIGGSLGGYTEYQGIVTGIQKPNETSVPSYLIYCDLPLSVSADTVARTDSFYVSINTIYNAGVNTFTGSIGIALYNSEGLVELIESFDLNDLNINYGWELLTFYNEVPSTIVNGDYKIYAVYKAATESTWQIVRGKVGTPNFINLTVDSEKIYFKQPTDVYPVLNLDSFTVTGNLYKDKIGRFNVSITNTGGEYNSLIIIYLQSTVDETIYQHVSKEDVNIATGETLNLFFTGTITMEPGEYKLATMYDPGNNRSIATKVHSFGTVQTINVLETPTDIPVLKLNNSISFPDSESVDKSNAELSGNIMNISGFFDNKVIAFIFATTGETSLTYFGYQSVVLDTNEEKMITFSGPIDLDPGQYRVVVYYLNESNEWLRITPNEYSLINFTLVEAYTGTKQLKDGHFEIYPNPVTDHLYLLSEDLVQRIIINDILGKRQMMLIPERKNKISIPVGDLKQGIYLMKIETENESKTIKFIKK